MGTITTGKDRLVKAIRAGRHIMGMDRETWQRYLKTHIRKARTQEQADTMPDVDVAELGTLQLNKLLDQMRKDGYGRKKGTEAPDPHAALQRGMIRTLWMAMHQLSIVHSNSSPWPVNRDSWTRCLPSCVNRTGNT